MLICWGCSRWQVGLRTSAFSERETINRHSSPLTPRSHIRFLITAGVKQVIESGSELGGMGLILGVQPAQGKADRQAGHLAVGNQGTNLLGGRLKDEIELCGRGADRPAI